MKEPYVEGLANYHGPKPCVGPSRDGREALEGEDVGKLLSHEIGQFGIADLVHQEGKATSACALNRRVHDGIHRGRRTLACVRRSSYGNWEISIGIRLGLQAGRIGRWRLKKS